jgi:mannan endo-1,4-beta-mannosidase
MRSFSRFPFFLFITGFFLMQNTLEASSVPGFHLSGRKILDANNNEFIMRGVNHAHTWYESELTTAITAIAKTGSNCVRVVLSNGKHGENWGKNSAADVKNVLKLCKENKLIAILEVHDCTGYPEKQGAVQLSTAVDYWIELKNELIGQEAYAIINIANEPFGNNGTDGSKLPASTWTDEHKTAIKKLRDSGFKHMLMVDAANWGQDWDNVMKTNAQTVFDADPDKNIVFSVHMYDVYKTATIISSYLKTFVDKGLPLVVGEFAADHGSSGDVDEATILSKAKEFGLGYIGWSWKGNSSGLESLDISKDWAGKQLSTWGERLINGTDGIKTTSVIASVFTTGVATASGVHERPAGFRVTHYSEALKVAFTAPAGSNVQICICDISGKVLNSIAARVLTPGVQSVMLKTGSIVPGMYIVTVNSAARHYSTPIRLHE